MGNVWSWLAAFSCTGGGSGRGPGLACAGAGVLAAVCVGLATYPFLVAVHLAAYPTFIRRYLFFAHTATLSRPTYLQVSGDCHR
jgi:hypothetical protein